MSRLESLRRKIDQIDDKIVALLVQRYECARQIGRTKKDNGVPVKDVKREQMVLKRVRSRARKPLSKAATERIYGEILKESRGMQSKKRTGKS